MASDKEIGVVMAMLTAAYPLLNVPHQTMRLYKKELADMPAAALMDAAQEHIRQSRFFPTIAELRQKHEAEASRRTQVLKDREWKRCVEAWQEEALPPGEAKKLLAEVNERAGTALVTARRSGMSRVVKCDFKAGADATDREWDERAAEQKRRLKESSGAA